MDKRTKEQYEELFEYRLAVKLADSIWHIVERWEPYAKREIGDHLLQTSDTMKSNIGRALAGAMDGFGEGFARKARSSLFETQHWLKKAFRGGYLAEKEADALLLIIETLGPRINRIIEILTSAKRSGE